METASEIQKIAFIGDYLPRKCGIATFTSDVLSAVAAEHPQTQCFAVPVNDIAGGYEYPDVVRFEIEEQNLTPYQRAAVFLNSNDASKYSVRSAFKRATTSVAGFSCSHLERPSASPAKQQSQVG